MKVRQLTNDEIEAIGRDAAKTGNEPVFQLANELIGVRNRVRGGEITAESIISAKDGRGRVRVTWHDNEAFLDTEIASGLGQSFIEAAAAARIDAALNATLTSEGVPQELIHHLLSAVRASRRLEDGPTH